MVVRCSSIIVFSTSVYAGEQVAGELLRLRGHRCAVVVSLVERHHRVGHGSA
jgi:hypothetical protein